MSKLILSLKWNGEEYYLRGEAAAKAREVHAVEIDGKFYSFKTWEPGKQPTGVSEIKKRSERPEGTPSAFKGAPPAEDGQGEQVDGEGQSGAQPADPAGPDPRILDGATLAAAKAGYVAAVKAAADAESKVDHFKNLLGGHSVARGMVPLKLEDGSIVKGKKATTRGGVQSRGYTLVTMGSQEAE